MTINDAAVAQMSGTVGKTFDRRISLEVKQTATAKYPDHVTIWEPGFTVATGDRITIRGRLSWAKSEKDGKTYMNVSINDAELLAHEPAASAPTPSDETPF